VLSQWRHSLNPPSVLILEKSNGLIWLRWKLATTSAPIVVSSPWALLYFAATSSRPLSVLCLASSSLAEFHSLAVPNPKCPRSLSILQSSRQLLVWLPCSFCCLRGNRMVQFSISDSPVFLPSLLLADTSVMVLSCMVTFVAKTSSWS
jgi:hypothetical protein